MFFYLFIIFQILYSVSCYISCYNAPSDINSFNYIVTADRFPTELQNSSLTANSISCYIQVVWKRAPDNTEIALYAETNKKVILTNHELGVEVGYENKGSLSIWEKVIKYQCNTDQCNSLNQLKRLLNSLIVNDSLYALAYLLDPVKPFHSEWCHRSSNATFEQCSTTIDLCTQCQLSGMSNQTRTELCTKCSTEDVHEPFVAYGKIFNMMNQTSSTIWMILCERENCNTPAIGDRIRERSSIYFDFNKFFSNGADFLSMNKLVLFFMFFFIKLFQ